MRAHVRTHLCAALRSEKKEALGRGRRGSRGEVGRGRKQKARWHVGGGKNGVIGEFSADRERPGDVKADPVFRLTCPVPSCLLSA